MLKRNRMSALRREPIAAMRIPCTAHVAPNVVKTSFGDYLQVLRLAGASFESADEDSVNTWFELLNVLWRNIASPNVALWTHVIRRRERTASPRSSGGAADWVPPAFARSLAAKYEQRLSRERLMLNEIYLAVAYRPAAGLAKGFVARILTTTN